MKSRTLLLAASPLLALALLAPAGALAASYDCDPLSGHCTDHVRFAGRHDPADARIAITTRSGRGVLVLTNRLVAVQLSDRTLHEARREMREDARRDEDDNVLANVIRSTVVSVVSNVLDHSLECNLRHVSDVEWSDGRLVLTTRDGERLFDGIDMDDTNMMSDFSERDARAFIREFHRATGR